MTYDHWKTRSPDDDYGEPPLVQIQCADCCGEGEFLERITVYEPGCGFPHDDTRSILCETCKGAGVIVVEAEGDIND